MSGSCCAASPPPSTSSNCPISGHRGKAVDWLTVAALVSGPVPRRQNFWRCKDTDCDAVYFGEDGHLLRIAGLRVVPGFKRPSRESLVCYCFDYRREDIEDELRSNGYTTILERITAGVKAGNCACEVRNPSGKCCLGEVKKAEQEIRRELANHGRSPR